MDTTPTRVRGIEIASLILGPALMSAGDLMHPPESWDPATQVAIIDSASTRWYAAHLLLFIGMLILTPGILLLTRTVALRRPAFGYASRVLILVSAAALSAVFAFEMTEGAFATVGDRASSIALLETFNTRVIIVLLPGLLAFFIGTGIMVATLSAKSGPFRWPALCFGLGALLILGEITMAQVLLSQIGNVLMFVAGLAFVAVYRTSPASGEALGAERR